MSLEATIETAFENRDSVSTSTQGEVRDAVNEAMEMLDRGKGRVAERQTDGTWDVNQWLKKAVLLSSITGSRLPQKTLYADALRLICATVIKLPVTATFHQNQWLPYSSLSRPSQLNVICDKLAKTGL